MTSRAPGRRALGQLTQVVWRDQCPNSFAPSWSSAPSWPAPGACRHPFTAAPTAPVAAPPWVFCSPRWPWRRRHVLQLRRPSLVRSSSTTVTRQPTAQRHSPSRTANSGHKRRLDIRQPCAASPDRTADATTFWLPSAQPGLTLPQQVVDGPRPNHRRGAETPRHLSVARAPAYNPAQRGDRAQAEGE